ncbi:hypothetical protein LDENG_00260600, partial [Lucifuga dentata]
WEIIFKVRVPGLKAPSQTVFFNHGERLITEQTYWLCSNIYNRYFSVNSSLNFYFQRRLFSLSRETLCSLVVSNFDQAYSLE